MAAIEVETDTRERVCSYIPRQLARAIAAEARRRGKSTPVLAGKILAIVARDNLFAAVLDTE